MPDNVNMLTGARTDFYNIPLQQPSQAVTNPLLGLSQATDAARGAASLQQQQALTGMQRLDYMHNAFGALASKPNATFDDVANVAANLVRMNIAPADQVAAQLATAPRDGDGIKAWAAQHQINTADHINRWSAAYGVPSTANLGDVAQPTMRDYRTGAVTPAGQGMAIGMSPEAKAARINGTDPNTGATFTAPQSSVTGRTGYALPAPVSAPTNSPAGANAATSMRPAGMGGGPQAASAAPAGAMQTSLPTGQTRMIDASSDRLTTDLDAARNIQTDLNPLMQARSSIMALGKNGIGPGVEDRNKVASFLQSAGLGWLPGVDAGRIENLDEALKYTTQAMQGRAASLRAGTDQQQATTAAGSPNLKMSSAAAINVVNSMIGLRRMQQAQTFENAHDGQGYMVNTAKWASTQDPRAYAFDLMDDGQKAKIIQSLGSKDSGTYKRFMNSLRSAHSTGLMEGGQ